MTVEELLEDLRAMPREARVEVQIRRNEFVDGTLQDLYQFRDMTIETVMYSRGRVLIQLDE